VIIVSGGPVTIVCVTGIVTDVDQLGRKELVLALVHGLAIDVVTVSEHDLVTCNETRLTLIY
jgi:hypothetical protein